MIPTPFVPPACQNATRTPSLKITNVRAVTTAPDGIQVVVVKVETNESEIYGNDCASYLTRPLAVMSVIDSYLRPFLLGRSSDVLEDAFQTAQLSCWRNGPISNSALSGVDQAPWDIKGKLANMPVHHLFGGRRQRSEPARSHVSERDFQEVDENAVRLQEEGFRHIRRQGDTPGNLMCGFESPSDEPYPPHLRSRQGA